MFHVHLSEQQLRVSDISNSEASELGGPGSLRFSVGALNVEVRTGVLAFYREAGIPICDAMGRSRTLCVVAVPPHLTVSDFVAFLGAHADGAERLRVLRDLRAGAGGRYMVLVRFHTQAAADAFYMDVQGRPFSPLDTEVCHAVYVAQLRIYEPGMGEAEVIARAVSAPPSPISLRGDAAKLVDTCASTPFSLATVAPAVPPVAATALTPSGASAAAASTSSTQTTTVAGPACASSSAEDDAADPMLGALTEMPTCPVCLERLDPSTSGVLTTICSHSFHCTCLRRWRDDTCAVCRYCFSDEEVLAEATATAGGGGSRGSTAGTFGGAGGAGAAGSRRTGVSTAGCEVCGSTANVWMCLVCGHLGCGRRTREHALEHYARTRHTYAIELASQRVWDYSGDGFVHRLIQNKSDGKIVEVPDPRLAAAAAGERLAEAPPAKEQGVALEYALLLTGQLDEQREYFEGLLRHLLALLPPSVADGSVAAAASVGGGSGGISSLTSSGVRQRCEALATAAIAAAATAAAGSATVSTEGAVAGSVTTSVPSAGQSPAVLPTAAESTSKSSLEARCEELTASLAAAEARAAGEARTVRMLRRQLDELGAKAVAQAEEIAFLRDVNDSLVEGKAAAVRALAAGEERAAAAAAVAADAQREAASQLQDLMYALDTAHRVSAAPEALRTELREGTLGSTQRAPPPPPPLPVSGKSAAAARLRKKIAAKADAGSVPTAQPTCAGAGAPSLDDASSSDESPPKLSIAVAASAKHSGRRKGH